MDDRRGFIKNAAKIGLGSQLLFNTPLELIANIDTKYRLMIKLILV